MEKWTKKILNIITKSIGISYCVTCYTIFFYKRYQHSIDNKMISFISGIIAWIPLINCILVGIIYVFVVFSEEVKEKRGMIYGILLLQFLWSLIILLPARVMEVLGYEMSAVLFSLSFFMTLFCHKQVEKELIKNSFSIKKEYMVMNRVNEEFRKQEIYSWSRLFDKMFWLFLIPYIIQSTPLVFSCITGVVAIPLIFILFRYLRCYKDIAYVKNERILLFVVIANFVISIMLGIASYYYIEVKVVSLMFQFSSSFSKLMVDNKYMQFLRKRVETAKMDECIGFGRKRGTSGFM